MFRRSIAGLLVLIVVLALLPQAISTATLAWRLVFPEDWGRDAVTSPERAKELQEKGLREQLVSFGEGMEALAYRAGGRADTQRFDIYAIGVGQITLNEPESDDRIDEGVISGTPVNVVNEEASPNADTLPTYPISGQFNNVLIFDRRTGEFTKLFDKRISVSKFQYGWRTSPEVLIIFAGERDTDKNGKLDSADLQDIYVFTFADKKLHHVAAKGINPDAIMEIPDVDYVVIKAVRDRNDDGTTYQRWDSKRKHVPEPTVLLKVDLKTFTASSFVPEPLLQELQQTLDGPKPAATDPKKE